MYNTHWKGRIKARIKAARRRHSLWVRILDVARLLTTAERRSSLLTRIIHRDEVHQTTTYTSEERYPFLFDLVAKLAPNAERVLSFGCSTGEEVVALRSRFPEAEIIGLEINGRSRRIASRRLQHDIRAAVMRPGRVRGTFDVVLALAVLQREPHRVDAMGTKDLTPYYPFARFDRAVCDLARLLRKDGLLCVINTQYRVEDSAAAPDLIPIADSPRMEAPLFGPDGLKLELAEACTIFRKRSNRREGRSG